MTDLPTRLEQATAGSRELDGLIYGLEHKLSLNGCTFMLDINGSETFQFRHPTKMHPGGPAALYVSGYDVTPVTTSIDAAVALAERVLPRWGFDMGVPARLGEHGGRPWADCWPPVEEGEVAPFRLGGPRPTRNHANAATPALALCAAIIRAQAEQVQG